MMALGVWARAVGLKLHAIAAVASPTARGLKGFVIADLYPLLNVDLAAQARVSLGLIVSLKVF
jgi:hypothetical protein